MKQLQQAVIEQLGYTEVDEDCKGELETIYEHGVNGGFGGFIYYTDTIEFFDDNRESILLELADMADQLGESVPDMVKGFNCLNDDHETKHAVDCVLMGIDCDEADETQVKNALAWFAAEQVAYQLAGE